MAFTKKNTSQPYKPIAIVEGAERCVITIDQALNNDPPMVTAAFKALDDFAKQNRIKTEMDEALNATTLVTDLRLGFSNRTLEYFNRLGIRTLGDVLGQGHEGLSQYHHMPTKDIEATLNKHGMTLHKSRAEQVTAKPVKLRHDMWTAIRPTRAGWYWVCKKGMKQFKIIYLEPAALAKCRWELFAGPIPEPLS